MRRIHLIILVAGLLWPPAAANALATYTYNGSRFEVADDPFALSDSITGYFTVAEPLRPDLALTDISSSVITFSFSAGGLGISESSSELFRRLEVGTNSAGEIDAWILGFRSGSVFRGVGETQLGLQTAGGTSVLSSDQASFVECTRDSGHGPGCLAVRGSLAVVSLRPGAWTSAGEPGSPIPEPTAGLVYAVGVLLSATALRLRPCDQSDPARRG